MVPLKKVFPIIVVLITLSLLGLIYIQFSWIHNASIVRREQIEERAINVLDRVREEMLARSGPAIRLKMNSSVVRPSERGLAIDKFSTLDLNIGVSDRFTTAEVKTMIINGLKREGLDTTFEFAIVGKGNFGESSVKMQSHGFSKMATQVTRDSVNYLVKYMPLLGSYEYMTDNTETMVVFYSQLLSSPRLH